MSHVNLRSKFCPGSMKFLTPPLVDLLHRVQKVMHINVMSPRSMNVMFTRIGFAIQKGIAAQLVDCLPSIQV